MILLTCFAIGIIALIFLPLALMIGLWLMDRQQRSFPWASLGASLMLIGYFWLPWLNLQPLKHVGLEWLYDAAPLASALLGLMGIDTADDITKYIDVVDFLFAPRVWLTLALTARPLIWFVALILGTVAFLLAHLTSWFGSRTPYIAWGLVATSVTLFVLIFLNLARIDGLGERPFTHPLTMLIPLLGAHIEWMGPLVTMFALVLMIFGGLIAVLNIAPANDDIDGENTFWTEPGY